MALGPSHTSPVTRLQNFLTFHGHGQSKKGVIRKTSVLHHEELLVEFGDVDELSIQDEEDTLRNLPGNFYDLFQKMSSLSIQWSMISNIGQPVIGHNLRHLHLPNNQLEQLTGIGVLTNLRTLDVSYNKLKHLPDEITDLQTLFHLSANGNMLMVLPDSMGQLKSLRELLLSSNQLPVLPHSLCHLYNLELLDVSKNRLMYLPDEIGRLSALEQLTASENQLTELPESLRECQALGHLHLSKNFISVIPAYFSTLPLISLTAANNRIVDIRAGMKQLKSINLDHNCLQNVPHAVTTWKELEILSVNHNRLKNFDSLTNLTFLRVLSLSSNGISYIPDDISDLLELRHLVLDDNSIKSIPVGIHRMAHLSLLKLENNNLEKAWKTAYSHGLNSVKEFARQRHLRAIQGNKNTNKEINCGSKTICINFKSEKPIKKVRSNSDSFKVCENNNYILQTDFLSEILT